jgi:hypothetical protein
VASLLKVNVRDRLTINQALSQPWIREKVYRSEKLTHAQEKIAAKYTEQKENFQTDDV